MSKPVSQFCIVRCGSPLRDEWTNVGIVVFGPDGSYHSHRIAKLDRAKARGDLHGLEPDDIDGFARMCPTVASVERWNSGTGGASSVIQYGAWRRSLLPPDRVIGETWRALIRE